MRQARAARRGRLFFDLRVGVLPDPNSLAAAPVLGDEFLKFAREAHGHFAQLGVFDGNGIGTGDSPLRTRPHLGRDGAVLGEGQFADFAVPMIAPMGSGETLVKAQRFGIAGAHGFSQRVRNEVRRCGRGDGQEQGEKGNGFHLEEGGKSGTESRGARARQMKSAARRRSNGALVSWIAARKW